MSLVLVGQGLVQRVSTSSQSRRFGWSPIKSCKRERAKRFSGNKIYQNSFFYFTRNALTRLISNIFILQGGKLLCILFTRI